MRAALFDMDGVLVDSNRVHWEAYRRTFLPRGLEFSWEEYLRVGAGAAREIVLARVLGELSREDLERLMQTKEDHVFAILAEQGADPIPGAFACVARARDAGLATAVCTSSRNPEPFLAAAGYADLFDVVIGRVDVVRPKPAPDAYLLAASRLGVDAPDCFVIEDSPPGVAAGRAAGARVLAVTTTTDRAALAAADEVFDTLDAIEFATAE